jgi:hypothetical protein
MSLATCSRLQQLPESLGQLSALSSLDLSQCSSLVELPESLGQLTALSSPELSECSPELSCLRAWASCWR